MNKCHIIFENNINPYEFDFDNLSTAIKYGHDNDWPIYAIQTPFGTFTKIENDTFNEICSVINKNHIKTPLQSDSAMIESESGEATQEEGNLS